MKPARSHLSLRKAAGNLQRAAALTGPKPCCACLLVFPQLCSSSPPVSSTSITLGEYHFPPAPHRRRSLLCHSSDFAAWAHLPLWICKWKANGKETAKQLPQMNEEWVNILFHRQVKYKCKVFSLWKKILKPFANLHQQSFYSIYKEMRGHRSGHLNHRIHTSPVATRQPGNCKS